MLKCDSLDALVTPFVDGELAEPDRSAVDAHLRACPPCHARVEAERAVHDLVRARRTALCRQDAPDALHLRCAGLVHAPRPENLEPRTENRQLRTANREPGTANENREPRPANLGTLNPATLNPEPRQLTSARLAPFALAASLVVLVGGTFVYQATDRSARVLAAELVADHAKCFAMNSALGTHQSAALVEQSMASSFGWRVQLPDAAPAGLELVGARPCLYGEGKIAHIMYRDHGEPVSLFMLPNTERAQQFVEVLGHEAKIWCANNRTFVVVAREPRREVDRIASFVQASLR